MDIPEFTVFAEIILQFVYPSLTTWHHDLGITLTRVRTQCYARSERTSSEPCTTLSSCQRVKGIIPYYRAFFFVLFCILKHFKCRGGSLLIFAYMGSQCCTRTFGLAGHNSTKVISYEWYSCGDLVSNNYRFIITFEFRARIFPPIDRVWPRAIDRIFLGSASCQPKWLAARAARSRQARAS